jgi:hypothetical protein
MSQIVRLQKIVTLQIMACPPFPFFYPTLLMSRSLLANHNPCRPTNKVTPSHQTGKFLKCDDTQSKGTVPVQLAMQDIVNTLQRMHIRSCC